MSGFQFATCERNRAFRFIRRMYPNRKIEDTPENIGPLLDLIEADIVRVQDPDFHQPCQIVAGTHYSDDKRAEILRACEVLKGGE